MVATHLDCALTLGEIGAAELDRRGTRAPDYQAESRALLALMQETASSADDALQSVVEAALDLCQAHTAGISLVETLDGREVFVWRALTGQWSQFLGGTMPREASPCGRVLECRRTLLLAHPERHYPVPAEVVPPAMEALLAPFYVAGRVVGTMWAVSHDEHRRFDREDIRLIESLSKFATLAFQRRSAEDQVRRNARMLELITDTAPVFIAYCDAEARFKLVNAAYAARFDMEPAQCIGKHIAEVVGQAAYDTFRSYIDVVLGGQPVEFEIAVPYASVGERFMHTSYAPEFDRQGRVVGFVAAIVDITERKRVEESLRRSEEGLKEADRRKDEFLAILAHELRNPLAPIRNAAQILQRSCGDAPPARAAIDMLERQVSQMVRLVDDLLDVSRISRGKIQLRRARIELSALLQDAAQALGPLLEAKRQTLGLTLPSEPIGLDADPARLGQIVGNLLHNACKFTPEGGHVQLVTERERTQAVIRVTDTGIGLDAEQCARIFEMFTQVDTSLERTHGGLGIGLTLVRSLVEMHGGTVHAHSAGPGRGSEFVVRLPLPFDAQQTACAESRAATTAAVPSRRVLIVDDNRDSAASLAMLLELLGQETRTAHDGVAGLEVASEFRPELVLLDIGLPRMNGYDVARRLRQVPWGNDIRLIALTGWGETESRNRSRAAGFDTHLVKPVEQATLLALLTDLDRAP